MEVSWEKQMNGWIPSVFTVAMESCALLKSPSGFRKEKPPTLLNLYFKKKLGFQVSLELLPEIYLG